MLPPVASPMRRAVASMSGARILRGFAKRMMTRTMIAAQRAKMSRSRCRVVQCKLTSAVREGPCAAGFAGWTMPHASSRLPDASGFIAVGQSRSRPRAFLAWPDASTRSPNASTVRAPIGDVARRMERQRSRRFDHRTLHDIVIVKNGAVLPTAVPFVRTSAAAANRAFSALPSIRISRATARSM